VKRNRVIITCAVTVLIGISAVSYLLRPREPLYEGKKLSQWLADEDSSGAWPRQHSTRADEAIRHFGTNTFPEICQLLSYRDSAPKLKLLKVLYKVSFIGFHVTTQHEPHHRAIAACYALGPVAKPLVPKVADALGSMDTGSRLFAQQWLASLGSDADAAVPALIAILKDTSQPLRESAAQPLAMISMKRREEVVPVLKQCLQDTNQMVRFWAEAALNIMNAGLSHTVPQ